MYLLSVFKGRNLQAIVYRIDCARHKNLRLSSVSRAFPLYSGFNTDGGPENVPGELYGQLR